MWLVPVDSVQVEVPVVVPKLALMVTTGSKLRKLLQRGPEIFMLFDLMI
jgi:hypothetical protein